jgi:hypothetical protein
VISAGVPAAPKLRGCDDTQIGCGNAALTRNYPFQTRTTGRQRDGAQHPSKFRCTQDLDLFCPCLARYQLKAWWLTEMRAAMFVLPLFSQQCRVSRSEEEKVVAVTRRRAVQKPNQGSNRDKQPRHFRRCCSVFPTRQCSTFRLRISAGDVGTRLKTMAPIGLKFEKKFNKENNT